MPQNDHDRSLSIRETQAWQMALDNLEQMHPRYLVELLNNGQLDGVLTQRVEARAILMGRRQGSMPGATTEEIKEIAQAEYLTPVNPSWQDEKPLTCEEKKKLRAFRIQ